MNEDLKKAEEHTILPVERLGDTLLIVPHGDLGSYSAQIFHDEFARLQRITDDPGIRNLIFDLSGSRYFGSEMIGALIGLRQKVMERGRVLLAETSQDTLAGLKALNVDSLFEFTETRSAAIRQVAHLSVGDQVHRYRRPLAWSLGLLLAGMLVWGIVASGLAYQIFGSRAARTYAAISRDWVKFQQGREKWTGEEDRTYRAEMIEDLNELAESSLPPRATSRDEYHWLDESIGDFAAVLGGAPDREQDFLQHMGYARHFIKQNNGLVVPSLGPEEEADVAIFGDDTPSDDSGSGAHPDSTAPAL